MELVCWVRTAEVPPRIVSEVTVALHVVLTQTVTRSSGVKLMSVLLPSEERPALPDQYVSTPYRLIMFLAIQSQPVVTYTYTQ